MPTYYDSKGNAHVLTEEIGRGGEGTVYFCQEDLKVVAKIYHEPITAEKAEKLRWMAENKNGRLLKAAAWVVDVLYDKPDGDVVGFLMPNVKAKEIHELYSLKSRRVYFPEATWHFLVHTAANVARAFYGLHKNEHVMGDVNHGNCVVLADGTVKLIDCDSFSIKTDKMRYRCDVGVTTHLAPELQGVTLSEVEREKKHDNFGLAVIIFQLLFLGRHPFSGNYIGEKDKTLEECITEYRFAYGDNTEVTKVRQPPGTLSLTEISPRVATFFERAFSGEDRPHPQEWVEALEDLSNNLEQCAMHPGHHFFNELTNCPWCKIEEKTGLMLFPFITGNRKDGEESFNIFTIEKLIANLGLSQNLPAKLPKPTVALVPLTPSPGIMQNHTKVRQRQIIIVGAQFAAMVFLMAAFGVGAALFLGFVLMIFLLVSLNSNDKSLRGEINDRYNEARRKWDQLEVDWAQTAIPQMLSDKLDQVRSKVKDYQNLQKSNLQKMKLLREDIFRKRVHDYLRAYRVDETNIPGIEKKERRLLFRKGVRSAAEIKEKRLIDFHKVDEKTAEKLLDWRKQLERNFKYEGEDEIPEADKARLIKTATRRRRTIEKDIELLLGSLRAGSIQVRQKQAQLTVASEKLSKELLQSESDLEVIGNNSVAVLLLLLVTFLTPFFGTIITEMVSPSPPTTISDTYSDDYGSGDGSTGRAEGTGRGSGDGYGVRTMPIENPPPPPPMPVGGKSVPDETITDKEIDDLSQAKREGYANTLYIQASDIVSDAKAYDGYYEEAEKKLFLANRFDKKNTKVLNLLGKIAYEQSRYVDSLEYLKRSMKINSEDNETKFLIGNTYLKMKNYKEARRIFTEVTESSGGKSFAEGFFNLGLAHQGLGNYKSAVVAFRNAVKLNPDDADSHYELGYSLYKAGDIEKARAEYYLLLKKDQAAAEKLRNIANL